MRVRVRFLSGGVSIDGYVPEPDRDVVVIAIYVNGLVVTAAASRVPGTVDIANGD